jgi:hypothetical protein
MNQSMMKWLGLTAILSSSTTWLLMRAAGPTETIKLDNAKVQVRELTYAPGQPRPRGIRQHDQVIVFLDDCRYERLDPQTNQKTIRERKSGDVIWHDKGEDAPELTNAGQKPYRTMVIELK